MSTHPATTRARAALGPRGLGILLTLFALSALSGGCGGKVMGRSFALPHFGVKQKAEGAGKASADSKPDAPRSHDPMVLTREQAMLAPTEPYWPYHLAELYLAADSLGPAEAALKASLARGRTYAPALSLLSKLYWESGRHAEAVSLLEVVRTTPSAFDDDARRALLAGLALHEDALGDVDAARDLLPADPRAARDEIGSAMVYVMLRGATPDSAAAFADAALDDAPKSAVNLNNTGITRLRAGDALGARKAFLAAIDRDKKLPGPYYNLAILEKFYTFDDELAVRWFKSYRQRSQADPDSLRAVLDTGPEKDLARREK